MARSPWNFLARLVGRDRKAQSGPTAEDEASSEPEVAEAESEEVQPTTIVAEPGIASAETPATSSGTRAKDDSRPKLPRKPARIRVARKKQTTATGLSPKASLLPADAHDEFLMLDKEIQELRRQLKAKLQSQNAQLRRMLDRFTR
ncbi:hypothetical protein [Rhizobium sp. SYY.PMSO]|uniref:hypothetical protein n=1 Tax=Rhizobium sp. SYY.PMSO TaxID=3382192 RepID=UPI000DDD0D51